MPPKTLRLNELLRLKQTDELYRLRVAALHHKVQEREELSQTLNHEAGQVPLSVLRVNEQVND